MAFSAYVKRLKKKSKDLRFIVLGLDNVGKTTIIKRILGDDCDISPTFGYNISHIWYEPKNGEILKKKPALNVEKYQKITLVDIGGQDCLRKYWSNFYDDINGIIFVYDIFDSETRRLEEANQELHEIRGISQDYPILLLANKFDLDEKRAMALFENVKNEIKVDLFFRVSGRTGMGLKKAFAALVESANLKRLSTIDKS